MFQKTLKIKTPGRKTLDITDMIEDAVQESQVKAGLCHLFVPHTSASIILCENTDPDVHRDLETFISHWCPDGNAKFRHQMEGPDDMPAHIRTILSHSDLTLPIQGGALFLGTWQGIYFYEHRAQAHNRTLFVSILS